MNIYDWANSIASSLDSSNYFEECHRLLVQMKSAGCQREHAMETLQILRDEAVKLKLEEREDRVLELMDIVSGFCRPDLRIWTQIN